MEQPKPTLLDWLCFQAYVKFWPARWQFRRAGYWLLERAGIYAYYEPASKGSQPEAREHE